MTLAEAIAELGLPQQADSNDVRRAYLRAIKLRKPETDPVGFQRVREAYELVRALGPALASFADVTPAPPSETPVETQGGSASSEPTPPLAASRGSKTEPEGEAQPETAPDVSSNTGSTDAIIKGFATAWHAVPPSAGTAPKLEIAREAVAALPAEPRAHWLMVSTLSEGIGNDFALEEALRVAWRAAGPEFLDELLTRFPHTVTAEEVDAGLNGDNMFLRIAAAGVLAPRDPGRASTALIQVIQAAGEGPPLVYLSRLLDVILTLFKNDDPAPALAAQAALRAWVKEREQEMAIVGGHLGGIWILTAELAALPKGFPTRLRREFASAAQSGEMNNATTWIVANSWADRRLLRRWRKRLGSGTPNIASLMDAGLTSSRVFGMQVRWFRLGTVVRLILVALVIGGWRTVYSHLWPDSPPRPAPISSLVNLQQAASDLCATPVSPNYRMPCDKVYVLVMAITDGRCNFAGLAFRDVRKAIGDRAPLQLEIKVMDAAAASMAERCPTIPIDRITQGSPQP